MAYGRIADLQRTRDHYWSENLKRAGNENRLRHQVDDANEQHRQARARIRELEDMLEADKSQRINESVARSEEIYRLRQREQAAEQRATSAERRAESAEQQAAATQQALDIVSAEYQQFKEASGAAPGWIYLIRERSEGHYKIGKAKDAEVRTRTFEVVLPIKIDPVCKIPTGNRHQLERELHDMFADKRVAGEWFALDDSDVEFIKSLAGGI